MPKSFTSRVVLAAVALTAVLATLNAFSPDVAVSRVVAIGAGFAALVVLDCYGKLDGETKPTARGSTRYTGTIAEGDEFLWGPNGDLVRVAEFIGEYGTKVKIVGPDGCWWILPTYTFRRTASCHAPVRQT
jgi:hypothetical protein